MKKRLLISLSAMAFLAFSLQAQIEFSDDFEGYMPGDLIGASSPDWDTWSGIGGGADDTPVSTDFSFSGDNSLRLYTSTVGGGATDIVLPFGGKHEFGTFNLNMKMFIVQGTGTYFNTQGETTVGQIWTMNVFFRQGGAIEVTNGNNALIGSGSYEYNTWLDVNLDVDLTNNNWVFSVEGNIVAEFSNPVNALASLNLYPLNESGESLCYIDDIGFEYTPPVLPDDDAAMLSLSIGTIDLAGSTRDVKGYIRNVGNNPINSFDVVWTDGTNTHTQTFDGYDIETFEQAFFSHEEAMNVFGGLNDVTVSVKNPNGVADGNPDNDSQTLSINGIVPAEHKAILVEEATGTWCPWCPRGAVFMDSLAHKFPDHFVGVAVHNGANDPMVVTEYDNGMTSLPGFTGFPSVAIERELIMNPAAMEPTVLQRVTIAPKARLANHVVHDTITGELTVTVQAEFLENVTGDYRLNAIVIEHGVSGTAPGYAQANAYAGGGAGPMGGYENLPSTVPASMMVYNEVGRALLGGYEGAAGSLPASITAGEIHEYTFTYVIGSEIQDMNNVEIASILIEPSGQVDNATKVKFEDFVSGSDERFANHLAEVYPNPFTNELNVRLALSAATNVEMTVFNAMGATVANRDYGQLAGNQILRFIGGNNPAGIYYIHIKTDEYLITKKVQLVK